MAGLALSGLASGMDWKSIVDQLTQLERVPVRRLQQEQSDLRSEGSKLSDLGGLLDKLKTQAEGLAKTDTFLSRTATVADASTGKISVTASPGAPTGTHKVNVLALATKTTLSGQQDAGQILAPDGASMVSVADLRLAAPVDSGFFTINGARVDISSADSLQDVLDRVGTATGGNVTATYDQATDKISLNSASAISVGSAADTSNFLTVTRLFGNGTGTVSSSQALGQMDLDSAIQDSGLRSAITDVDASGNGVLSINGLDIAFNVQNDSLRDLMDRVNTSEAGVEMRYDATQDQFELVNQKTGTLGLTVDAPAGGLAEVLQLGSGTTALGQNARFTIDGSPEMESTSNQLDASVHGIKGLSVEAMAEGASTFTVEADTGSAREKLDEFISAYNAVHDFIDKESAISTDDEGKVTTGILSGNREVTGIASDLRDELFQAANFLTGDIKRIQDIGIDFEGLSSKLSVDDSDVLDEALKTDAQTVFQMFSKETDGLSDRLGTLVEKMTEKDGTLSVQQDMLDEQAKRIDDQIDTMERLISQRMQAMTESFLRMEEAQQKVNQQMQILNNSLPKV